MAWIRQVPEEEATGALAKIYKGGIERVGAVANIIKVMSLRPGLLGTFLRFYLQVMKGKGDLSRADREMLATVTSQINGCFY